MTLPHEPQLPRQRQEPRQEYRQQPRNNRRLQHSRNEKAIPAETNTPLVVERGESNVLCFVCQQPAHYVTQCPRRKGKEVVVTTITTEVQQVTT